MDHEHFNEDHFEELEEERLDEDQEPDEHYLAREMFSFVSKGENFRRHVWPEWADDPEDPETPSRMVERTKQVRPEEAVGESPEPDSPETPEDKIMGESDKRVEAAIDRLGPARAKKMADFMKQGGELSDAGHERISRLIKRNEQA